MAGDKSRLRYERSQDETGRAFRLVHGFWKPSGVTHVLSEERRPRGGRKSRRTVARVWKAVR